MKLDPNETNPACLWGDTNPVRLWAEIHRLRAELQGPDGYATWKDAAIDLKLKLAEQPNLACKSVQKRLAEQWGYKGALCRCGDRPVADCDEEWGPDCDLGNNEKWVRVRWHGPRLGQLIKEFGRIEVSGKVSKPRG